MIKFTILIMFILTVLFIKNKEDNVIENKNNDAVNMFDEDLFKEEILESIHGFIDDTDLDSNDVYIPFK